MSKEGKRDERKDEPGGDFLSGLERAVSSAVRQAGGAARAVVDAIADVLCRTLWDAGQSEETLRAEAPRIARRTARAAVRAESDCEYAGRGFMIGLLRAAEPPPAQARELVGRAAASFVEQAHGMGGDVLAASRGLVEGAIVWAQEAGWDPAEAARAAAQGAADASYDIRRELGEEVRRGLSMPIGGVSFVVKEPHS